MELRKRRLSDGADVPQKVARRELAKLLEDAEDITESLYAEQDIISRSLRYYKAISPFANHLKLSQHAISTSDDVVEALKAASGAIATLQQHSAWLKSEVSEVWELVGRRRYWYRGDSIFIEWPSVPLCSISI